MVLVYNSKILEERLKKIVRGNLKKWEKSRAMKSN